MKRGGLIAKEGRTIPLNRISGVDFEIGVIDRLFGCGTLIVSDASTDGQGPAQGHPARGAGPAAGLRRAAPPRERRPPRRWRLTASAAAAAADRPQGAAGAARARDPAASEPAFNAARGGRRDRRDDRADAPAVAGAGLPGVRRRGGLHRRRHRGRRHPHGLVDSGRHRLRHGGQPHPRASARRCPGWPTGRSPPWSSRVEEMEAGEEATGSRHRARRCGSIDEVNAPLRGAAGLRLAPPPRRRGGPDRGDGSQGRGPPHDRRQRRVRRPGVLHRAVQHPRP